MDDDFCEPTQPVVSGEHTFLFDDDEDPDTTTASAEPPAASNSPALVIASAPAKSRRTTESQISVRSTPFNSDTPYIVHKKTPIKSLLKDKLTTYRVKTSPLPRDPPDDATRLPSSRSEVQSLHSLNSAPTSTCSPTDPSMMRVRVLGTEVLPIDIRHASFAESNEFIPQELILVPRKEERFDYGRVMSVDSKSGVIEILVTDSPPMKKLLPALTVGKIRSPNMTSMLDRPREILETINLMKNYLKRSDQQKPTTMTPSLRQTCLFLMSSQAMLLNEFYQSKILEMQNIKTEQAVVQHPITTPTRLDVSPSVMSKIRMMRKRTLELLQCTTAVEDELTNEVLGIDLINLVD
eukprot:Gregarina_sp_Pseudo_9__4822@NODE_503_length_2687_cov_25_554003_g474_i0_p2_GENE_NODE_503_length_2687_cov_25_554003_g474_i0NODE_503_length_2687_cov_25_554003_g474_i0_p2_ORF_typecomplete_len351_score52_57_NODE_503_length_2687_cov_25_554003_g474_i013492401